MFCKRNLACITLVSYRLAKTRKMPYFKGSLSAKEFHNQWLFCRKRPATCKIRYVFSPHCTGIWHHTLGAWHHILDVLNFITHSVYWISIHPMCDAIHQNSQSLQASHIGCTGIWHHTMGVLNCSTPNVWCQTPQYPIHCRHHILGVLGMWHDTLGARHHTMGVLNCNTPSVWCQPPNHPFNTGITY